MIHLLNETLNVNNQRYYYGSINSLLLHFSSEDVTFTEDNYRLNNNILRIGFTETFTEAIAMGKNTVVLVNGTIERVYNVISYVIQSGYILYTLQVDLWHTYAYGGNLSNLRVCRSTRVITQAGEYVGFYPSAKQCLKSPTYKPIEIKSIVDGTVITSAYDVDIAPSKISIVMAIKHNTFQDQDGATSVVNLFGIPLDTVLAKPTSAIEGVFLSIARVIQEFVNGIYECRHYVNGTLSSSFKAQLVNAWLIDNECIESVFGADTHVVLKFATKTSISGMTDYEFKPAMISSGTHARILTYAAKPHTKVYIGTKYNNLELAPVYNYNEDTEVEIRYVAGNDTMSVYAIQGDNQVDITSAFTLNIVQVDGDITLQRQILSQFQNTLPIIASAGTIGVGIMTQNPVAIGGGILSLANSASKYAEAQLPQHMGNIVRGGDAISTFCENSPYVYVGGKPRNPYYIIEIEDDKTAQDELKYYGLVYDTTIALLSSLNTYNDVTSGTTTAGTVDGFDYLQCTDLTFTGNAPKEAQEFIYNKLIAGIRIKVL